MKRPLIGITCSPDDGAAKLGSAYTDAIIAAGGAPLMIPIVSDKELLAAYIDRLDGFLFTGGGDVDPMCYGELTHPACGAVSPERDEYEIALAQMLIARRDKPVLGICRGIQLLNVAAGGTLYQDVPSEFCNEIAHTQKKPGLHVSHPVKIEAGTLLHDIMDADEIWVNSFHHQAVRQPGKGCVVCAHAPDGLPESIYMQDHPFYLGVQWHPERLFGTNNAAMSLFKAFVSACC